MALLFPNTFTYLQNVSSTSCNICTDSASHICWFTASPHIMTSVSQCSFLCHNTPNFSHTSSSYGPNNSWALWCQAHAIYILVSCDRPHVML